MKVAYYHFSDFPGWDKSAKLLLNLIQEFNAHKVLEIGSGANPTLNPEKVASLNIKYTTNDLSGEELAKASSVF